MFVNAWSILVSVLAFLNPLYIYIYTCNYLISPTQKSHRWGIVPGRGQPPFRRGRGDCGRGHREDHHRRPLGCGNQKDGLRVILH